MPPVRGQEVWPFPLPMNRKDQAATAPQAFAQMLAQAFEKAPERALSSQRPKTTAKARRRVASALPLAQQAE